jgi:hypothetical protein
MSYATAADRAEWQTLGAEPIGAVVGDHEIVREGLRTIFEAELNLDVGGEVSATEGLVQVLDQLRAGPSCGC